MELLVPPSIKQFNKAAAIDGPLDREQSGLGRVEQSYLRALLFGGNKDAKCSLCKRELPINLLVAAHIKPRCECSRRERLDASNIVFAVCVLGCDAFFEKGLVAIDGHGKILASSIAESVALRKILNQFTGRRCVSWSKSNAKYFEWHLKERFQG